MSRTYAFCRFGEICIHLFLGSGLFLISASSPPFPSPFFLSFFSRQLFQFQTYESQSFRHQERGACMIKILVLCCRAQGTETAGWPDGFRHRDPLQSGRAAFPELSGKIWIAKYKSQSPNKK
jgi:hypothetical protein